MVQDMEVGLNRSTTCPCSMLEKVLMTLRDVDIGIGPALLRTIIQAIMLNHQFYSYGDNISVHGYHTRNVSAYITMVG